MAAGESSANGGTAVAAEWVGEKELLEALLVAVLVDSNSSLPLLLMGCMGQQRGDRGEPFEESLECNFVGVLALFC